MEKFKIKTKVKRGETVPDLTRGLRKLGVSYSETVPVTYLTFQEPTFVTVQTLIIEEMPNDGVKFLKFLKEWFEKNLDKDVELIKINGKKERRFSAKNLDDLDKLLKESQ